MEALARVVAEIDGSEDLADVQRAVRAHVAPFGYDRLVLYSAASTTDALIDRLYWVEGDWFGEGQAVDAETYLRRCPITRHILETDEPFFWTKSGERGAEIYRVVNRPRGGGVHGLQVPVFGTGGLKGAMSFGGTRIDSSLAVRLSLTLVAMAALRAAERLFDERHDRLLPRLSAREREVLRWVAAGRRQAEIALVLGVSERTVENHMRRIRSRLGAATTAQAVLAAIRSGEIETGAAAQTA